MVYDTLLVLPLVMASVALFMGLRTLLVGSPEASEVVQLNPYVVQLMALLTVIGFFCWFWIKNGQTLGMQAWRLRIDKLEGGRLSLGQALIRILMAAVSAACFGLGYLWILFDRDKRSWHDICSKSRVVLLPK